MHSSDSDRSAPKQFTVQEKEIDEGRRLHHNASESMDEPLHTPIVSHIKRWPQHPLSTHYPRSVELAQDFYDLIVCMIPVLMIIKAVLCVVAAKKDHDDGNYGVFIEYASNLSKKLVIVNKQMTTIFTILFLVIIGTMFKRLALWKAQRGARLSMLELLQASVSPTSTLKMIASLRIFTVTSALIASVWLWYYAGSQAAVFEFTLRNSFAPKAYPIALLGANALSPFEDGTWSQYTTIQKTDSNSIFHVYSQKVKGQHSGVISSDVVEDALPLLFLDETEKYYNQPVDKDGFTVVARTADYSIISAVGTHYYINDILDPKDPDYTHGWHSQKTLGSYSFNASYIWVTCDGLTLSKSSAPSGLYPTITMSLNMTDATTPAGQKRTFDFWNLYNTTHAFEATCGVQQLHQEVTVNCDPKSCKVNKIRSRPGYQNPSNDTRLFAENSNAQAFFDSLLYACGRPVNTSDTSTFEADNGLSTYKADLQSGKIATSDFTGARGSSVSAVQDDAETSLSFALAKYFNTYIAASKHLKYEHGFDAQELASEDRNITINNTDSGWDIQTMVGAEFQPNYAISWPWIIIDLISSSILLGASIFAFWLRKTTEAPDIFGYVSSLTRDNAFLDVPGGSALGGIDRTRMMKHVQVKIGEIPTAGGVGRIVLTYVGDNEKCARDLEKGKVYI